jgi:predicted phage baseplate assembly protein
MSLPLPRLDDRDFDQLVLEARETLPANGPAWTDHNASDPGITLIELFAYLAEIGLYRLDRVPAAEHRAFLRLLGFPAVAAQAAQTVLAFESSSSAAVVSLPPRVQVGSSDGCVVFQTTASLDVVSAKLVSVLTFHADELVDCTTGNDRLNEPFAPFGMAPSIGDALYLGFDRPLAPAGVRVRLHVFGEDAERDRLTWIALAAESRAARRESRETCPGSALHEIGRYWSHYSARLTWEYFDPSGEWLPLSDTRDRTRALSISGPVHFRAPGSDAHARGGVRDHATTYFIRGRLRSGEYDCAPIVRGVRINTVAARHAADLAAPETLVKSLGHPRQTHRVARAPVVPGSTRLELTLPDASREIWTEALNWDRSGPLSRDYVLDPESGSITFGDGRQGRVPPADAVMTLTYRVGGGAAGNVGADTQVQAFAALADGPNAGIAGWNGIIGALSVRHPVAARGGRAAETVAAAEGRSVRGLALSRCAVTLQDFERLALSVPGVPVARAHAIGSVHPQLPCLPAAGCVTVLIVPSCAERRPEPSAALCSEIAGYLNRHRPVATEVHVVGPRYTKVTVHARVHLAAGNDCTTATARAREALDEFFHPLRGGPASGGWPVGRSVYRTEVLALLMSIPGVSHVTELELQEGDGVGGRCGNVETCPDGLVLSGEHRIDVW